jgi:dihydroflavonol-4-reductase
MSGVKAPRKAPAWVLKLFGYVSVMIAAVTGKEPDVTPEIAAVTSESGTSFSSDKAIRELGYRIQPMTVAVKDNYDWLVKEGLLAEPG